MMSDDSQITSETTSDEETNRTVTVAIDDSNVQAIYANMCRVSSTPEEVILDLMLNPNPVGTPPEKLHVSQRVIVNHYTAKRMVSLLAAAIQRHESTFGVLETDVRKRMKQDS